MLTLCRLRLPGTCLAPAIGSPLAWTELFTWKKLLSCIGYGAFVQDIWRTRLGRQNPNCALRYRTWLVDGRFWLVGIRQTRGVLRWSLRGHLHRSVSLHAHIDSGRHAHVHRYARDVGDASRSRRRRTSPEVVGIRARGQPGNGASPEELGGRGFPPGHGFDLSPRYASILSSENMEAAASIQRSGDRAADRGTLAHTRHASEPSLFRFHFPQRPGQYHGFLWFFFMNEQVLRFLNLRYPRDYNTVPRLYFWLFHLLWLFPWSVYFPAALRLRYRKPDRASRTRLLALCWCGFILFFFTLSTTQEYYSMPCYPALALLLGSAMDNEARVLRWGTMAVAAVASLAAAVIGAILWMVRGLPAPGDIASALNQSQNVEVCTLSLGHMGDLTLKSFA